MNRKQAIQAILSGKEVTLSSNNKSVIYKYDDSQKNPFRAIVGLEDYHFDPGSLPNTEGYEIYTAPKMEGEYMTREEALAFCIYNKVVVRRKEDWSFAEQFSLSCHVTAYEWAYIHEDGTIGSPHKFVK